MTDSDFDQRVAGVLTSAHAQQMIARLYVINPAVLLRLAAPIARSAPRLLSASGTPESLAPAGTAPGAS